MSENDAQRADFDVLISGDKSDIKQSMEINDYKSDY